MSRLLVTGAGGAVGSYAMSVFSDRELVLPGVDESSHRLDVGDADAVLALVRDARPETVLHLAAATDVDLCETDPELAFRTNAQGTENVARGCLEVGATLVYVSTGAVFDGEKPEPYTELDETGPVNVYGRSKLAGEHAVSELLEQHYIVRAGWMVGGVRRDTKFVGKIVELIGGGRSQLSAVDDKIGSPIYAPHLLEGIKALLETRAYGTYHLVNAGGPCSRYDMALAIRDVLGRPEIEVEPVSSDAFPLPAPRGRSEALRSDRLALLGLAPLPDWRDALGEYLTTELMPHLGIARR